MSSEITNSERAAFIEPGKHRRSRVKTVRWV